ncbi:Low temperature requirement protein LtrA, partial [Rhizoctonia solani AG-3 Rhs1AP]
MILTRVTPEDLEARSGCMRIRNKSRENRTVYYWYVSESTDVPNHNLGSATHIEHLIGRTAAFVVIVLGQIVPSVVYHTSRADVGFKSIYASAVSGLIIAFNFYWLYFDAECSHTFVHAMRRHYRFTPITFTNLHFPLCAYLIFVSAATSRMAQRTEQVTLAIRWYFDGGLGVALISIALIGATHCGLDPTGTCRLGSWSSEERPDAICESVSVSVESGVKEIKVQ